MASDKEMVRVLFDTLEELLLEKFALISILITNENRLPAWLQDWKSYLDWMKRDADVRARVRASIAPLRQRMEQDQNLSDVIEAFLKISPPTDKMH